MRRGALAARWGGSDLRSRCARGALLGGLLGGLLGLSLVVLAGCGRASGDGETTASPEGVAASSPAESPGPRTRQSPQSTSGVSALGRLEPQGGIVHISGPSDLVVVVRELFVDRGERIRPGQLVATLDTIDHAEAEIEVAKTEIARVEAELANARREMRRSTELSRGQVAPEADREHWEGEVAVLEAELAGARAELASAEAERERSRVYSPLAARVLEVHTWPGERVGEQGILEVARTDRMVAIAEVYETDIGRVRLGQRATVTSPALAEPLTGTVEWIALKVDKQDAIDTDPAARKDARVVEVEVALDDSAAAAGLTNLQVEILIEPGSDSS